MKSLRIAAVLLLAMALGPVSAQAAPAGPGGHPVAVRVLASGGWRALPVSGARLLALRGGRVVGRGRAGSRGVALLRVRGSGALRVLASGGRISGRPFRGTMAAEVRRYRWPATVHVDSVSTLASRYRRAHPGVTISQAKGRTKRFLALPASYVVGLDGTSNAAFDGRRFLAAAGTGERYDRFVARLATRIGNPRARRSFAHVARRRHSHGQAATSAAAPAVDELEAVTEAISEGSGFFEVLDKTDAVLDFADAVLEITGAGRENAATPAEIERLSAQLQQIEQSVGVVQTTEDELREQVAHAQYSQLAGEAIVTQTAADSAEDTLHTASLMALEDHCFPRPQPETKACDDVTSMIKGPHGFSADLRSEHLTTAGEVRRFGEKIAGSALPGGPPGFQGLIQDASALTTYHPHQVFFTSRDSEQLRAFAGYWIAQYAEALAAVGANLRVEGVPLDTIENEIGEVGQQATQLPKLLPDQVPAGTAIDMAQGWMWPTEATGYGTSTPYGTLVAGDPWAFSAASRTWASGSNPALELGARMPEGAPAVPFANWQVAGGPQINAMLEAVTPEPGQLEGEAVVEQAGMAQESITPWYPGGHGLETEWVSQLDGLDSACRSSGASCWWPILAGEETRVTSFHTPTTTYYYVDGTFTGSEDNPFSKWFDQQVFGFNGHYTIFGSAPIEAIPVMFYRSITGSECYFYPAPEQPTIASPGCP